MRTRLQQQAACLLSRPAPVRPQSLASSLPALTRSKTASAIRAAAAAREKRAAAVKASTRKSSKPAPATDAQAGATKTQPKAAATVTKPRLATLRPSLSTSSIRTNAAPKGIASIQPEVVAPLIQPAAPAPKHAKRSIPKTPDIVNEEEGPAAAESIPKPPVPNAASTARSSSPLIAQQAQALRASSVSGSGAARSILAQQWKPYEARFKRGIPFLSALIVGLLGGAYVTKTYLTAPTAAGTAEDGAEVSTLEKQVDELFIVKVLRGKALGAGKVLRGEGLADDAAATGWVELPSQPRPGSDMAPSPDALGDVRRAEVGFEREKHLHREQVAAREAEIVASSASVVAGDTAQDGETPNLGNTGDAAHRLEGLRQQADALGLQLDGLAAADLGVKLSRSVWDARDATSMMRDTLGGASGLGVERGFFHAPSADDGSAKLVSVVWLGKGLCGWPGVVHGGLLATVMLEKVGVAGKLFRDTTSKGEKGRTAHADGEDWRALSQLEIQYRKPTYAGAFYVIRAAPAVVAGRVLVEASLETLEGDVCVKVKGALPPSGRDSVRAAALGPLQQLGTEWWVKLRSWL